MNTKADSGAAVVIERTFDAPIARVWDAITDVDQMRDWYFDLKEFRAEVGFEFEFAVEHEGNSFRHLCRVIEAVPHKRIAYTWCYAGEEGESVVTFALSAEGERTRLKLTHEGLETFPDRPAYARKNFEAGWTSISADLQQFVEGQEDSASAAPEER